MAGEIAGTDPAGVERMVRVGDDARGHAEEEAVAPEEPGQGLPGVDAADMQVGPAVGEQPEAVAPAGGPELQLDLGEDSMVAGPVPGR